MSQQFKVGVFALLTVFGIFAVYYVLSNLGLRSRGYQIAVHFKNVAGLQEGSSVELSGVEVGIVDSVTLFPDQTAQVVATIRPGVVIYRGSRFAVATSLTGQTTLTITGPTDLAGAVPMEHGIPPEDRQPVGRIPATLADLAEQGASRLKDLDKTLAVVNRELPRLTSKLNAVANHTDALMTHSDAAIQDLQAELHQTIAQLDVAIASTNGVVASTGRNVENLTADLDRVVSSNQGKINLLVDNLAKTADNLNKTMEGVSSIAQDPQLKGNFIQTTANIKDASQKIKQIANDVQSVTGDPKVQTELRGAVHDLSSAIAKTDDILGTFSGAQAGGPPPAGGATPSAPPQAGTGHTAIPGHGLRGLSLVKAQVRETWNAKAGGGPQSDLNLTLLPKAPANLILGANDLGYAASYNFLISARPSSRLTLSGGVLYSNLGAQAVYWPADVFGIDARLYDPKHPKLDLYGNVRLSPRLELFYGERRLIGPSDRQPAFGVQATY